MLDALLNGLGVISAQAISVLVITALLASIYVPAFNLIRQKTSQRCPCLTLGLWISISLIFQLAFIHKLTLPLYFDSAEHARIINALRHHAESISAVTPRYYHLGYHVIAAFLATTLQISTPQTMLLFGQIILTLLTLPVFLLIWHETGSETAALFSALLANFAWSMPGFAVNWGKYPMLTGLYFSISTLFYVYLLDRKEKRSFYPYALIIGIVLSILTHSRMAMLLSIAALAWMFTTKTTKSSLQHQRIVLGFALGSVLILWKLISNNSLLQLTFDPYLKTPGSISTLLVLTLTPFAYKQSSKLFFFNLFLTVGMLVSLFIPIKATVIGLGTLTILDRPFVETVLFLPLAIFGGLGLAKLLEILKIQQRGKTRAMLFTLLGIFAVYSLSNYSFAPSACCNFVSSDDINAMTWIDKNTQPNATILIAGKPLNVTPYQDNDQPLTSTDAGVWVSNLTARKTLLSPYTQDFDNPLFFIELCQRGVDYIYAGNQSFSFNASLYKNERGWYDEILSLPKTRLFVVQGCP